jgi:nucleotide-binding universal stress UspA family protein
MNVALNRILVPTDFSAHSERALRYAAALAARVGASLDVLHVVEDPFASGAWNSEIAAIPNVRELRQNLLDDAERRLKRSRTAAEAADVTLTTTARMGRPAQMIVDYAAAENADLIVMGTHGRTGLKHALMGSVAERVVQHAPCPVLTLRAERARGRARGRTRRARARAA